MVTIFSNRTGIDLEKLVQQINTIIGVTNNSFTKIEGLVSFIHSWPIFAPCKEIQLVFDLINKELERQRHGIELIASENFTSLQVMQAMGNVMTNKYAEGYPGRRYYAGCEIVDQTEQLAIDRLKQIFNCDYANVQPHSGAQANAAVLLAILAARR